MDIFARTDSFLRDINMHPQQTDMRGTMVNIISEMERGLAGESSSLAMIPTYVSPLAEPVEAERVIVIDVGGTNLRVGVCRFEKGKPVLELTKKAPVPGSRGEITAEAFFDAIAEEIFPLMKDAKRIGMCFSYPAEIFPDRDGSILRFNKEIRISGAEGAVIGAELKKRLADRGVGEVSFTLLNDTTAAVMGAVARLSPERSGGIAGLVLGTGCNCCYLERGVNITKLTGGSDMLINCESGCFDGCRRGKADEALDSGSELPGDHLLEKMVSGAYLGALISKTAELAAGEGLLSEGFSHLARPLTTQEIDEFMRGERGVAAEMCRGSDAEVLGQITGLLFERAARIVCAMVAAVCEHCDGGKSEAEPFILCAEGSTFWQSLLFRDYFSRCAKEFISGELGRGLAVLRSDNATLEGAALAVFTSER